VFTGPTGVGKTSLSVDFAKKLGVPIISADSRQFYREIPIGTAAPKKSEMKRVKHYFIGNLSVKDYYNASMFEEEVMDLLTELYSKHHVVIITGGSMMYLDAVCKGIDEIPAIDPEIRMTLKKLYEEKGINPILDKLEVVDPIFFRHVEGKNHKRVIHALEVCLTANQPYSLMRKNVIKYRPFKIIKIGLTREREELYERINRRVDKMMDTGFLKEARKMYPFRNFNALNTVGYKELFSYLAGECTLSFAVKKIKKNTRIYARKQMSWLKKDKDITWFNPDDVQGIWDFIFTTTGLLK
jgi:tRNA dimethylallyltransferase